MSESSSSSGSVSLVSLLTVLFVGLKLTDYIDWSWWWVLSPLWISASFWGIVIVAMLGLAYWFNKE